MGTLAVLSSTWPATATELDLGFVFFGVFYCLFICFGFFLFFFSSKKWEEKLQQGQQTCCIFKIRLQDALAYLMDKQASITCLKKAA